MDSFAVALLAFCDFGVGDWRALGVENMRKKSKCKKITKMYKNMINHPFWHGFARAKKTVDEKRKKILKKYFFDV